MHATLSYLQSVVLGLTQGVTELFPVSSLGHGVLIPALLGWHNLASAESAKTGFFLAFLVGLHVGTAVGLFAYYRATWIDLLGGLGAQLRAARTAGWSRLAALNDPATDARYRLLALLVLGTIPVAIVGLAAEKALRVLFTKPLAAAIFLTVNGVILLVADRWRRRAPKHAASTTTATLSVTDAIVIGSAQTLALLAGISRSGVTMVAGLVDGLDHEDAANFAFLLATPVILLAGLYKLPELFGTLGQGVRAQTLVGAMFAMVTAYLAVRFLTRWFQTRTLTPFAVYCLIAGLLCVIRFA